MFYARHAVQSEIETLRGWAGVIVVDNQERLQWLDKIVIDGRCSGWTLCLQQASQGPEYAQ
jgi:hypothetical protein